MGSFIKLLLRSNRKVFVVLILAAFFNQVLGDYEGRRWGQNENQNQGGRRPWGRFPSSSQQHQPSRVPLRPSTSSQVASQPSPNTLPRYLNSLPVSPSGGGSSSRPRSTTQRPQPTSRRPTLQDFQPPRYIFPSAVTQPRPGTRPPTPPPPTQQPPTGNRPAPPLQGRPTTRYSPTSASQPGPTIPPPPQWGRRSGSRRGGGWSAPPQDQNPSPSQPSLNSTLNPYLHNVSLDSQSNFRLSWVVDWSRNITIFNVTVRTTGWIGFGFSLRTPEQFREGEIVDLIIGGVYPNGSSYFTDRHDTVPGPEVDRMLHIPPIDSSQDWILHDSWERGGLTFLSFSRPFDTCDPDDIPITEDSLRLLWAIGDGDDIVVHTRANRGIYDAYLLTPDLSPREVLEKRTGQDPSSSMQVFNMTSTLRMPARNTTYWCTWHKTPQQTKHHIIGFDVAFPTEIDRRHVHHLLIHRCYAPRGVDPDDLFGPPSQTSGSECYYYDTINYQPMQYCRETMHVWGVGGRPFFFPDHVGLAMSETEDEYISLQVHYDNPEHLTNQDVTVTLQAFYTAEVREHDVSMLGIGQNIPAATSIVVPPMSIGHATVGTCPSACTEKGLKGQEVNILAGWLHTHTTGAASRFMHLRGGRELPWILFDDNWNFNFQQFRVIQQERRLIPGDQLVARCEYDTTRRMGRAVAGGFGTQEAMCTGHVYYYPRQAGFSMCRTVTRDERYWDLIKMKNATWDTELRQVVVTGPPEYAGLTVTEHINQNLDWTPEFRRQLQTQHLFGPQVAQCPDTVFTPDVSLQDLREQAAAQAFRPLPPDPNAEHFAINPRNIPRLRRPPQCSRRNPMDSGRGYAF